MDAFIDGGVAMKAVLWLNACLGGETYSLEYLA